MTKEAFEDLLRFNCSTLFLMPILGIGWRDIKKMGFCNCYLRDENKPEYEDMEVVLLLFQNKGDDKLRYFVEKEKARTPLFIDEYDYEEGYIVLVYEFPEELKEDYHRFKRGEYTKLSESFRKKTPKTTADRVKAVVEYSDGSQGHTTVAAPNLAYMAITKDPVLIELLKERFGDDVAFEDGRELWKSPDEFENLVIPPIKRI
jgi:hypothetical protein